MGGRDPTKNESTIMAWTAFMTILSLPAGIVLAYVRSEARHEREVSMWRVEDIEEAWLTETWEAHG